MKEMQGSWEDGVAVCIYIMHSVESRNEYDAPFRKKLVEYLDKVIEEIQHITNLPDSELASKIVKFILEYTDFQEKTMKEAKEAIENETNQSN